jgi:hypothetical protein
MKLLSTGSSKREASQSGSRQKKITVFSINQCNFKLRYDEMKTESLRVRQTLRICLRLCCRQRFLEPKFYGQENLLLVEAFGFHGYIFMYSDRALGSFFFILNKIKIRSHRQGDNSSDNLC